MAKTLLLVEDNLTIQDVVKKTFASETVDIIVAGNAVEGVQQLYTTLPDIVVVDAAMTGLDGFQMCQIIRGMTQIRHIPVLLLTSGYETYDEERGRRVGVTDYLTKPFAVQTLRRMVEQLLPDLFHGPAGPAAGERAVPRPEAAAGMGGVPRAAKPYPLSHVLGKSLLLVIQETLRSQLTRLLHDMTPQILDTVRETVATTTPALLEELLQREIEHLKRAAERDDHYGDREGAED